MFATQEEIEEIIEKIKQEKPLIIVEGKKDKAALEKLGLSNIMELSKKPLFQIVEEVANSNDECIILTDLDKKGKEIYEGDFISKELLGGRDLHTVEDMREFYGMVNDYEFSLELDEYEVIGNIYENPELLK